MPNKYTKVGSGNAFQNKEADGNRPPYSGNKFELELRIDWLENGLKEIANGRDDMNAIHVKQQAQAILDGEPTTADKYNDVISQYEDHEIQSEIKKVQSEIKDSLSPENTVRISDINEEIAKEWNRDREERINKEKTK